MSVNTRVATKAEQALVRAYDEMNAALPGAPWVRELRNEAISAFMSSGLPHRRIETWKWTDLRALMREAPPPARPASEAPALRAFAELDSYRLVFVNGFFAPALSTSDMPDGIEARRLADVLAGPPDGLAARIGSLDQAGEAVPLSLNTAFMTDGAVVRVKAGIALDKPLHVAFIAVGGAPEAMYLRNVVVVEEGARLTLIESHEGPDTAYQSNIATELFVAPGADVRHVRLQDEGIQALHLHTLLVCLGGRAYLDSLTVSAGAGVARNQIGVMFDGDASRLALRGAGMLAGRQHCDTTLVVDHATLGCESREIFKCVLDEGARGVFQGKIIVRQGAQKTDGKMMSQGLFLSEDAEFDTKPELEIFADDVQCGHGATAGQLDENQLFYLMARGLPRREAERLLIRAFIAEAFEAVEHDGLRHALEARAERWLAGRRGDS